MGEEHCRLFNLILHSISQNNVLASFMATTLHNIEKCLKNLEKFIALSNVDGDNANNKLDHITKLIEDNILGKTGQQSLLSSSNSQKDKIDLIA